MPDIWMDVDTALAEVPVNLMPLLDDTDFKSRETAVAYNAAGMDLVWNFVTPAGAMSQTAVTPTTSGTYDWTHQGDGMYSIEIPASGGASINNDTEGFGWFTGVATGVLPWRGPVIGFRASGLNDALIESAYSTTRGLAGTALPNAAADAAGGLPISDAGGLDMDALLADTNDIQSRLPAALVGGRMDASVGAMAANVMTAAAAAADLTTELQSGLATAADLATVAGYVDTEVAAIKTQTDKLTFDGANHIVADARKISTSSTAADNLEAGALAVVVSTCAASSTTTTVNTNLTEATDDHFNGRVIIFTSGALAYQASDITDYNGTTKALTVTALTEAPANSDAFVIV